MKNKKILYTIIVIIFLSVIVIGYYGYLGSDRSGNPAATTGVSGNQNESGVGAEGAPPVKPSPSGN